MILLSSLLIWLCSVTCWQISLQEMQHELKKVPQIRHFTSGPDGSRTRVQKSIPCPSTSVSYVLTFPPPDLRRHSSGFSSFIIRPQTQSFVCVVSHIVEAWILKCECSRSDCCHHGQQVAAVRLQPLNYLQRLILILEFDASRATRFSSFMIPVETITSP